MHQQRVRDKSHLFSLYEVTQCNDKNCRKKLVTPGIGSLHYSKEKSFLSAKLLPNRWLCWTVS